MSVNPENQLAEMWRTAGVAGVDASQMPLPTRSPPSSPSLDPLPQTHMAEEMDAEDEMAPPVRRDTWRMDGALPENDGMKALREKIHEIKSLAVSTEERAKRMHSLMVQDYLAHKGTDMSPASLKSGVSTALSEEPGMLDVGVAALPIDPSNPYDLRPADLEVAVSPLPPNLRDDEDEDHEGARKTADLSLGCRHYKRNVKIQCFDCHRWFPCRHCHDQSHDLPFEHNLRRKMTKNMLCMLCLTPQPAERSCVNCGEWAANYYCSKCQLWDNDANKRIYHCDDCGICRVGEGLGKDYVHCKRCNVCISISTSAAHPCIEGATEGDCPLCLEHLFESKTKVVSLPCGHYMHAECYKDLMAVTYKCPVCGKSAVNMELQWRKLDDEILAQPMPEDDDELEGLLPQLEGPDVSLSLDDAQGPPRRPRTVWIGCNDCSSRSRTPFHWLGLKCQICDSYNTNQMAPTAGHETEAERLIRQNQIHHHHDFTGEGVLRDAGIQPADAAANLRADSALAVPSSPLQLAVPASPASPCSSSGLASPPRYFTRADEEDARRPSLASRGFSAPVMPQMPEMPRLPRIPHLPNIPQLPTMANLPQMPHMPHMPYLPPMPHLDLPRFSPAEMFDSLSRGLTPMRYYLQGLEVHEHHRNAFAATVRERRSGSPAASARSDPTADELPVRRRSLGIEEGMRLWGSRFFRSREEEETESESESESEAQTGPEDWDDGDDDEGDEEMYLFGHR